MKKILFGLMAILFFSFANAQKGDWITQVPKDCFCCSSSIFNLPQKPVISGPSEICVCDNISYSIPKCDGAKISWSVKDSSGVMVPFTGQGTSNITLSSPLPVTTKSFKIIVTITCGDRSVSNELIVKVKPVPNPAFPYSITADGNGGYTLAATGVSGYGNAWKVKYVANDEPCNVWAGNDLVAVASTNFSWNYNLLPGKQYRLIHWVEKCSPTWQATAGCLVVKYICFKITPSAARLAKGSKAAVTFSESESLINPSSLILKDAGFNKQQ